MRDQYALNGTPSTSTKWVREPQTFDTFHVDFDLFAPFSDTTASHGSTFSTFDLTNDDITLDTSHGRDRCSQQPSSFSTDGETQGRYHPTRPTAIDGSHPNESYGDRLAREILYITHTGLQETRLPSCTTIRTQLQKPNPSLHEKGILEPRPYRRA